MTVTGGALVPPPLPVLPATLGTGVEGGLDTVMAAVPATLTLPAGIVAVIWVEVIVAAVAVYGVNLSWEEPRVQVSVEY